MLASCARANDVPRREIAVATTAGHTHRFQVEIADTPQARERGLMFRKHMPAGQGMLFVFPADEPVAFWMRNTLIPLDLIFIERSGRIIRVAPMAKPLDETLIESGGAVRYVLELNGGEAARRGIRAGDKLVLKAN